MCPHRDEYEFCDQSLDLCHRPSEEHFVVIGHIASFRICAYIPQEDFRISIEAFFNTHKGFI